MSIASHLMVMTAVQAESLEATIYRLRDVSKRVEEEIAHLRAENKSLWDSVYEKDGVIAELRAMVERAHQ